MDCNSPGFPFLHQLLELAQIYVHWVSDAIQPFHPLASPSPAFSLSQHQGFFQWVSSLHQMAKVLEFGASVSVLPKYIQDWFSLGWISLQSKGLSSVFSNTTVQKHQFFGTQLSLWSNSHIHAWLLERPWLWLCGPLLAKWCLLFNVLSRFVIIFIPRIEYLLIS